MTFALSTGGLLDDLAGVGILDCFRPVWSASSLSGQRLFPVDGTPETLRSRSAVGMERERERESGPIRGKPRVDRFRRARTSREGWRMMNGRAKGRQLDCHASKMCLRDVFARKTQKGTRRGDRGEGEGGGVHAIRSFAAVCTLRTVYRITVETKEKRGHERKSKREREREREREGGDRLASSSSFWLADPPGASRRPL